MKDWGEGEGEGEGWGAGYDGAHDRAARGADEGVLEHLRQLGAAEGHVGPRPAQRADALLEAEEALVDLRAVEPVAAVVALRLGRPLRAGEVDEAELALQLALWPRVRVRLS